MAMTDVVKQASQHVADACCGWGETRNPVWLSDEGAQSGGDDDASRQKHTRLARSRPPPPRSISMSRRTGEAVWVPADFEIVFRKEYLKYFVIFLLSFWE